MFGIDPITIAVHSLAKPDQSTKMHSTPEVYKIPREPSVHSSYKIIHAKDFVTNNHWSSFIFSALFLTFISILMQVCVRRFVSSPIVWFPFLSVIATLMMSFRLAVEHLQQCNPTDYINSGKYSAPRMMQSCDYLILWSSKKLFLMEITGDEYPFNSSPPKPL